MGIKWIKLRQVGSTNAYLRGCARHFTDEMVVVSADYQTAGKGQGGNHWESEAGKNLLFSILSHPVGLPVRSQFMLSMAGALSIKSVLDRYVDDITLKWPNDIYWKDRKLSGTLIELTVGLQGIRDCVYGVGINVNQRRFLSDAPNPVSLVQVLGRESDRERLLCQVVDSFAAYSKLLQSDNHQHIQQAYQAALYRSEGIFPYEDKEGPFYASIVQVTPSGHLLLKDADGRIRSYGFKEVKFIQQ